MLEIGLNEKVTKNKHSQTPIDGVNIYFTILKQQFHDIFHVYGHQVRRFARN